MSIYSEYCALTQEEHLELIEKAYTALCSGDEDETDKYMKRFPVRPGMAKVIKIGEGIEGLQDRLDKGYDFSLVEAKYGKNWINTI